MEEFIVYGIVALLIILGAWFVISLTSKKKKQYPRFTSISLPHKINPSRTVDDRYGVGTFMLDIVTIGGHGELKKAIYEYETSYIDYARVFNAYIDDVRLINNKINKLGKISFDIFYQLEKSKELIGDRDAEDDFGGSVDLINQRLDKIDFLISRSHESSHTGASLLQGVGVGGLAAVGSWVFVSLVGTASTGTAIATLSGAAAYNATLAWFGGGAIAAGGGGMAAGVTTLGLIFAVPVIAIATYKTHSKIPEVESKRGEVERVTKNIFEKRQDIKKGLSEIDRQIALMATYHEKIKLANQALEELIYPNGMRSKIKRNLYGLFGRDYYSAHEVQQIEKLTKLSEEIYELFNPKSSQSQNLLEYKV